MRKVWDVVVDLVYEDAFQFLGPIAAIMVVGVVARWATGAWLGIVLFLGIALALCLSLRRALRS